MRMARIARSGVQLETIGQLLQVVLLVSFREIAKNLL